MSTVQYSTVLYLGVAVGVVAESRCLLLPRLLASSARWSQCGDPGDLHLRTQYSTVQYYSSVQYSTVQYSALQGPGGIFSRSIKKLAE